MQVRLTVFGKGTIVYFMPYHLILFSSLKILAEFIYLPLWHIMPSLHS